MKQLPCSLHPLNHLVAQELALHAALADAHGLATGRPQHDGLWQAAAQWARSRVSVQEALTYHRGSPLRPRCSSFAESLVSQRLAASGGSVALGEAQPPAGPARLVALYAPRTVLGPLPHHVHDTVLYDEAVQHEALLSRLVAPLGVTVSLTGGCRRGCPLGQHVEVLWSLSAEATSDLTAAAAAVATKDPPEVRSCVSLRTMNCAHTPTTVNVGNASHGDTPQSRGEAGASGSLHDFLPTESCPVTGAYAATDTLSGPTVFRFRRAMQGLAHAGYLVAGRMPNSQNWGQRDGKPVTVRLDPHCPHQCPPHQLHDSAALARLKLHRLIVHVAPRESRVVRQLFLTGPATFTSHVTLKALAKGYELNENGLFVRTTASDVRTRILLRSEADLFRILQMPHVHPFNRGIYCQVNRL